MGLPARVQVDALLLFTQLNNTKVLDKPEDWHSSGVGKCPILGILDITL